MSGTRRSVSLSDPRLPGFLDWVHVGGLRVGAAGPDLVFERRAHDVGVNVLRRTGEVRVVVSK